MACLATLFGSPDARLIAQEPLVEFTADDRPGASEAVQRLIDRGKVTFEIGEVRPSTQTPIPSTGDANERFDAETRFRLRYQFDARCRYGWTGDELWLRVRYPQLELLIDHRIWFRSKSPMATLTDERFWDDPIVRHELDHVHLSSDPRMQSLFRDRVESRSTLRFDIRDVQRVLDLRSIDKAESFTNPQLRTLIGGHVKTQFAQIVEMIEIRYQELDRVTSHGRTPVPETGVLRTWLGQP